MATPFLILNTLPPYDGEYELVTSGLTTREYHQIRQVCGLRAAEIEDGLESGDVGLMVALTAIMLQRAGHTVNMEILWNAPEESFDVQLKCSKCAAMNGPMDIKAHDNKCKECGVGLNDDDRPLATATSGGNESPLVDGAKPKENGGSTGHLSEDDGA